MDAKTPKTTTQTKPQPKHIPCHVSDKCNDDDRQSVNEFVCRDLETTEHTDDKHYCLLHLPTKNKDIEKFEELFQKRLHEHNEEKRDKGKREISIYYDFRYLWFPKTVNLEGQTFSTCVDFSFATFAEVANFNSTIFFDSINFNSAIFNESANFYKVTLNAVADFKLVTFSSIADFREVSFNGSAYFQLAIFEGFTFFQSTIFNGVSDFRSTQFLTNSDFKLVSFTANAVFYLAKFNGDTKFDDTTFLNVANFESATFSANAFFRKSSFKQNVNFHKGIFTSQTDFDGATFSAKVNFEFAKFLKSSEVFFIRTKFHNKVSFRYAVFVGFVFFKGDPNGIFLNNSSLDLQDTRIENPERINFHTVRLKPSWFVNTDLRSMVFNDIIWENTNNIDCDIDGVEKEIENLKKHGFTKPKEGLLNTFVKLCNNSEANLRFEEAKKFEKLSIALKEYKCHVQNDIDSLQKESIRRSVCQKYPVVNEDGGLYYCLWHNPNKNKAEIFLQEFKKRQHGGHTDFRSVVFPISITYSGNLPNELTFTGAKFQRTVMFSESKIHKLNLNNCYFEENSELLIEYSTCDGEILITDSTFDGRFTLNGSDYNSNNLEVNPFFTNPIKSLTLANTVFNKPSLVRFREIDLYPHYFVGVDSSKFIFDNVSWQHIDEIDLTNEQLKKELESIRYKKKFKKNLVDTFNQLADNSESNRRRDEAKNFKKNSACIQNEGKCYVQQGLDPKIKDEIRSNVCKSYPVVNEYNDQYYCLWHNPDKNKAEVFLKEFEKHRKNLHEDYRYIIFPIDAKFDGKLPAKLQLSGARFQKRLVFHEAEIHNLYLDKSYFEEDAELVFEYSECDDEINLDKVVFDGRLNLSSVNNYNFFKEKGRLSMKEARFDKPNWINFRNVRLLPEYFFDVDSSKFTFHDCKWNEYNENRLALDKTKSYQTHQRYAQTCNHLAINYEENRHFEESSMFRYASMESKRLSFIKSVKKDWFNLFNRFLYLMYKWTSGYGENWVKALGILVGLLIGFGVLFYLPISTFDYGNNNFSSMNFVEGIIHSLSVATFQRPEPKPYGTLTKLFIVLEIIFVPLQAALLALAIRRKFMR